MKKNNQLLDEKSDFYLLYLCRHAGNLYSFENLVFQKEYFLQYNKNYPSANICLRLPEECKIPLCDLKTIKDVKNRMNYLVELIAALDNENNIEKSAYFKNELDFLTNYLKKSIMNNSKIYHFPGTYSKMRSSVLKSINRSLKKVEQISLDIAKTLKSNLETHNNIGFISDIRQLILKK